MIDIKAAEAGQRLPHLLSHCRDRPVDDSCVEVDIGERIHVPGRVRPLDPAREHTSVCLSRSRRMAIS